MPSGHRQEPLPRPLPSDMAQPELLARWHSAPVSLRRSVLSEYVCDQAARTIGLPGGQGNHTAIDPAVPLQEYGLDSLMAVELRNLLGAACGMTLPATLLFDHPSVNAVVDYLVANVPGLAEPPGAERSVEGPDQPLPARGGARDCEYVGRGSGSAAARRTGAAKQWRMR